MTIGDYYQCCFRDKLTHINDWYFAKSLILQSRPYFNNQEADAVYKYMKEDNFFTEFKYTSELETALAKYTNSKYCIMVNNGTVSLILALMALDIGIGCDVIVPNYTMIASINAIKMVGANPIIIDVNFNTFTIDLITIKKHLTSNTKAIMHVSLNNYCNHIQEISDFCNKNHIYLVEDAAQSLGCRINGKHIGTFGIIGSFSLSTPKIISTGQGGFLITDNENIYKKISMIKNFGRKESGIDDFETFGLNFKFTDIQAIIGLEQLKKLNYRVLRMREIFDLYYQELQELNNLPYFKIRNAPNHEWIPWFIEILVDERDSLAKFLKHHNIQTRPTYPSIHNTNMYKYLNIQNKQMRNSIYI
jgi:perosamine synthetase